MSNVLKLVKMSYLNLINFKRSSLILIISCIPLVLIFPLMVSLVVFIACYSITILIMTNEENSEIDTLISYVPVRKSEYVLSRYLLVLINLLSGILLFTVYYILIYLMKTYIKDLSINQTLFDVTLNMKNYLFLLIYGVLISILTVSIAIPFKFKFKKVGRFFDGIAGAILGASLSFLINFKQEMSSGNFNFSNFDLILYTVISSFIIIFISYILSIKIYKKKELL
ncbi:MAG: ABC-2 transporter permease [Clostridioides difficile]|nr:ABC-2 transporter permease [Clostridioides difficile]